EAAASGTSAQRSSNRTRRRPASWAETSGNDRRASSSPDPLSARHDRAPARHCRASVCGTDHERQRCGTPFHAAQEGEELAEACDIPCQWFGPPKGCPRHCDASLTEMPVVARKRRYLGPLL